MATVNSRIQLKKDTVANWTNSTGKAVVLLNGEMAIEGTRNFKIGDGSTTYGNLPYANSRPVLTTITSNTTLTASHCECFIPVTGSRTITIGASIAPIGTEIEIYNAGGGTITIAAASGVTRNGVTSSSTQYEILLLKCIASNTWIVSNGLTK